ncbi:MAG: MATE family efflux transporter [Clostridia bacterium]|nr:MATE family efflux transporter [Clostridia bacterium]
MQHTMDMTSGKPARLLVRFAVPMMLGGICQHLYSIVDSVIVGRLIGVDAFAAIGATALVYWTSFSVVVLGLNQGFGILFAQRFGAKDMDGLRKAFAQAIILAACFGTAIAAAGLVFARPLLSLLHTPADIMDDAALYLKVLYGGIVLTAAYNLVGSLLRALGNSKTPLYAVLISSVLNIALDTLFVAVFRLGVGGVAAATLVAQLFAFVYCLAALRRIQTVRLCRDDFRCGGKTALTLLGYAIPLALRNGIISAGGLAVQYVINGYGTLFVAGMSAPKRFYGIMELVGGGMEGAVATFVGQNFGANQTARVRDGVRAARRISVWSAVLIAAVFCLLGRQMLSLLFVGDAQIDELLDIGNAHLSAMAAALPALYMLFVHRSAISGMGNTLIPMLSGFVELAMRILAVFILPALIAARLPGLLPEWGIYVAESVGWVSAAVLLTGSYAVLGKRLLRADPKRAV